MIGLNRVDSFQSSHDKIAIVCGLTGDGRHCGILYKDYEDQKVKIFHLLFHFRLGIHDESQFKRFFKNAAWVEFSALQVKNDPGEYRTDTFLVKIKKTKQNSAATIPYGLKYTAAIVNVEGILELAENSVGLTCATFIMAMCKGMGLELVNVRDWQSRAGDPFWQEEVLNHLTKYYYDDGNITLEHIWKVADEKVSARFRPEEVTAASNFYPPAAPFLFCEQEGAHFMDEVRDSKYAI